MGEHHRKENAPTPAVLLAGSALLAVSLAAPAGAVTAVSIDGHPSPVTITVGEAVAVRFDVARARGAASLTWLRDLARTGHAKLGGPTVAQTTVLDSGGRKDAVPVRFDFHTPAGPYVLEVDDLSNGSYQTLPVTLVPQPEAQAISGRVAVASAGNPAGSPPADAIVWAYKDPRTPVASADVQPDGTYTLPVPPGTYLLFAQWFGHLRSQRQVVTVMAGQTLAGIDLPLVQGEEVSGTVRDDQGQPLANAPVQATATGGATFTTQTLADGSYLLALPSGPATISARGGSQAVTVADEPQDGVDFPSAAPGPAPAVGTVIPVAGNGIAGLGGDGRPATAARLFGPFGLALDRTGNLYIADDQANRIRKVDAMTGLISTVAGNTRFELLPGFLYDAISGGGFGGDGGPATAAQFRVPEFVAFAAAGDLYVSDVYNTRLRKINTSGIITTGAVGGPEVTANFYEPEGLAIDPAGDLFIADGGNNRVRRMSPGKGMITFAGGGKAAVKQGAEATAVALGYPHELAVDAAGNLYIGDDRLNQILKVSPAGVLSLVAGTGQPGFSGDGGPATAARISGELALAVDSAGNLFFADNNRIRRISPDGTITTVAGNGRAGSTGDGGPAAAAEVQGPLALAIDAAGDLFFTDGLPDDYSNRRIREVIGIAAPGLVAGG